jgi:hypothetical protein
VWSSPTIRAAIVAGLDVHCAGCKTSRVIDIRTIDRHPLASVGSLVLGLRCSCSVVVNRVMPELIGKGRVPTPGIGIVTANETVATRLASRDW